MNPWVDKEKLTGDEFRLRALVEVNVHYCKPRKGEVLGDENEEDEMQVS